MQKKKIDWSQVNPIGIYNFDNKNRFAHYGSLSFIVSGHEFYISELNFFKDRHIHEHY